jgi:hypothetical protein
MIKIYNQLDELKKKRLEDIDTLVKEYNSKPTSITPGTELEYNEKLRELHEKYKYGKYRLMVENNLVPEGLL